MEFVRDLFHRIMNRITGFFTSTATPEFSLNREPFEAPPPHEGPPPAKKKRDRKGRALMRKNLADLLDNLDVTFDTMKLPTDKLSWLPRETVTGLKRLGVYVPDKPWKKERAFTMPDYPHLEKEIKLPAMMAVSFCVSPDDPTNPENDDLYFPNTMFAVKHSKIPPQYTQLPGVAYEFGYSYNFARTHNFWIQCFLVIDPITAEVKLCHELRGEQVTIPVKRGRKNHGPTRQYMSTKWRKPMLTRAEEHASQEQKEITIKDAFLHLLYWWNERDLRWSVGVRKGKDRVVFSVDPENTKTYFADRDKSIKAADGKAKKIIHYVRAHERIRSGKTVFVREHIRGIREFDWGKHHCIVTSPKFHKTSLTSEFDLPAMDEEEWAMLPAKQIANMPKAARMLADLEEMDLRKRA